MIHRHGGATVNLILTFNFFFFFFKESVKKNIKMILKWWLGLCFIIVHSEGFQFNMTEYYQMPKLYNFDDYDRCLKFYIEQPAIYCFVRAEVLPSDVASWQVIEKFSNFRNHHFDHRHLYFGLCLQWCEDSLAHIPIKARQQQLFAGVLTSNEKVNVYLRIFADEEWNRRQYNELMNQCLNLQLKENYGLEAKSVVEYCVSNEDEATLIDPWNVLFCCVVSSLVLCTVASSVCDFYLKSKAGDQLSSQLDYYKSTISPFGNKMLVVFSVKRNWYRLRQEPNSEIGRALRFFDCFKFFSMFLVIFAHTNWILYESSLSNPEDSEQLMHTPSGTLLMSGGVITVTFLVIAGFLLTINWLAITKAQPLHNSKDYLLIFGKFNIYRYIRLTIPYGFFILMSGVKYGPNGGPLYRHVVEKEQLVCRRNWWINLLYLNTFIRTDERCLLQSWYLAADTHCFILSLGLLLIAYRWPCLKRLIYIITVGLFFLIPGLITYFNDYNGFYMPALQTQKDSFIGDEMFKYFYTPFYMNFGCYFAGVLAALIYNAIQTSAFKLKQFKSFQILWYALIPAGIFWIFTTQSMMEDNYQNVPLLLRAIYAGMQRNLWGIGVAIFIVGMSSQIGGLIRRFCCLPMFRILGRLTYGAFLSHLLIARLVVGSLHKPIYFCPVTSFAFVFLVLVLSYLVALLHAFLLELPVSAILNIIKI